jgi:tripartite-type tricarboxylate transporter receptor subunit TctC
MNLMRGMVLAAALATLPVAAESAGQDQREKFPSKPVRLVTVATGNTADILSRMLARKMSEGWGQAVVVENRAGSGGTMAASTVARAAPDGYTLLLLPSIFAIGAAVRPNLPYDAIRDFSGVIRIGSGNLVLVVAPSLGVKSVPELIELARSKPAHIFFASGGAGTNGHLDGERIRLLAGIDARHVAFKGSPEALIEVMAGRVHYTLTPVAVTLPFIKEGKLVAIAVANPQGSPLLPGVPALVDVLPGYGRKPGWTGLLAPAGTPRPILNQINQEVRRVLDLPDIKAKLQAMEITPAPTTPEEFDRIIRDDIADYAQIARTIGLTVK